MLTLFILVSAVLMVVVLLQSSKGGGLAGAIGGGASDSSVLGGRGTATFLGKATVYLAVAFMSLSLLLAIMSSRSTEAEEEAGIIAKRQQEGALDVYQVEQGASILDELQTEGFEEGSGEGAAATGSEEAEPAPAGDQ